MLPSVHLWLADQAQSSVSAWLTSPAVALVGLIASAVSVLQALISTTKWFIAKTDKPSTRRRLTISLAVCIIASIVVLAPVTWEMMAVEDTKAGSNPLWVAEVYPFIIFAPLTMAAYLFLTTDFHWKGRAGISPFIVVMISLALPTALYDYLNSSVWERCLVSATPSLTAAMLVATYLAHFLPRAKPHAADAQKSPSATEKVA